MFNDIINQTEVKHGEKLYIDNSQASTKFLATLLALN